MIKKDRNIVAIVFIFVLILGVILNVYTSQTNIRLAETDADDYLGVAKGIHDFNNKDLISPIRGGHSWGYGIILFFILKISYSLTAVKIFNFLLLLFTGLFVYLTTKKTSPFILFVFSPIFWVSSYNITPIMVSAFLLVLFYYSLKKFSDSEKVSYLILGCFLLGLSSLFWIQIILVGPILILILLFDKKSKYLIIGFLSFAGGFLPNSLLEYFLFKFPFFSIIRSALVGVILAKFIKLNVYEGFTHNLLAYPLFIIIVSPLFLYFLGKIFIKKRFKEFTILCSLFLLFLASVQIRYALFFAPIFFIFIKDNISKKEMIIHLITSFLLIGILFYAAFSHTSFDTYVSNDLKKIGRDFPKQDFIVGINTFDPYNVDSGGYITMLCWNCGVGRLYNFWEYDSSIKNSTALFSYTFEHEAKYPISKNMRFIGEAFTTEERINEIKTVSYLIEFKNETNYSGFSKLKCYDLICLFSKEKPI